MSTLFSKFVNNDTEDFVVVYGDVNNNTTAIVSPAIERRIRSEVDGSLSSSSLFFTRTNPNYFDELSSSRTCAADNNMTTMEEGRRQDLDINITSITRSESISSNNISITLGWYCIIGIIIAIHGIFSINSHIDFSLQCFEFIVLASFASFNIICLNSKFLEPSFSHWFINTFLLSNVWKYGVDSSNLCVSLALSHSILPIFIFMLAVFNKI